jgi:hypothetical protein
VVITSSARAAGTVSEAASRRGRAMRFMALLSRPAVTIQGLVRYGPDT